MEGFICHKKFDMMVKSILYIHNIVISVFVVNLHRFFICSRIGWDGTSGAVMHCANYGLWLSYYSAHRNQGVCR